VDRAAPVHNSHNGWPVPARNAAPAEYRLRYARWKLPNAPVGCHAQRTLFSSAHRAASSPHKNLVFEIPSRQIKAERAALGLLTLGKKSSCTASARAAQKTCAKGVRRAFPPSIGGAAQKQIRAHSRGDECGSGSTQAEP